jgi:hypothetical protein
VVLTQLKSCWPDAEYSFYRTAGGAEIDLVVCIGQKTFAIECKASLSPSLTKGNYSAIEDINPLATFIVSPVEKGWPVKPGIGVTNLNQLNDLIKTRL